MSAHDTIGVPGGILALDPARLCGFAHSCGQRGTRDIGTGDIALACLRELIVSMHSEHPIGTIAYEAATFGGGNRKGKGAQWHTMARLNEITGVIRGTAAEIGASTIRYAPSSIKKWATGSGKATKRQVMRACKTMLGVEPKDDNESDALWMLDMARGGHRGIETRAVKRKRSKAAAKRQPKLF